MTLRLTRLTLPMFVVGTLLAITIGTAVATRLAPKDDTPVHGQSLRTRQIQFSDRADGGVDVTDSATGQVLEAMTPNSNNFVRATMRGLVRQRIREGVGPETPFRLTAWVDGGLTLEDPATNRHVELEAFGAVNAQDFARILQLQPVAR